MKKHLSARAIDWLLNFTILQLFLTLISLPILIRWGMPLSYLSPLGNLLLPPFLTVFLICSTLLFFTSLLSIPNQLFIMLLEMTTHTWDLFFSQVKPRALISFAEPPLIVLLLIPLCAIVIVQRSITNSAKRTMVYLLILLISSGLCMKTLFVPYTCSKELHNGALHLALDYSHGKTTLTILNGPKHKKSYDSWIDYTLMPTLIRATGQLQINQVVIEGSGSAAADFARQLQAKGCLAPDKA